MFKLSSNNCLLTVPRRCFLGIRYFICVSCLSCCLTLCLPAGIKAELFALLNLIFLVVLSLSHVMYWVRCGN